MSGQMVNRFGTKFTKPGRTIHTGRTIGENTMKRSLRPERELRPRLRPRVSR